LLEGQPLLRDLLARTIQANPRFELIGQPDDLAAAQELCRLCSPELVLADVRLPSGDGIQFLQELRGQCPSARVLVLSQATDPLTLQRLKETGVHGFVEKEQSLEIVEEAMTEVAGGHSYFTPIWTRTHTQLQADPQAFSKFLSAREQAILRLVAAG